MIKVVGVRFKSVGKIYYFDPKELDLKINDSVIVETQRGIEYGKIVIEERMVGSEEINPPLREVLRLASQEDEEINLANKQMEEEAKGVFEEKVKAHKLEMSLTDVELSFDRSKIIFYFVADGRVDFRDLVRDLASVYRTRIELRQIGVRDQAKVKGGIGPCGRICCCKEFMGEFCPVNIKMAKDQGISLNPSKISGICGRLMCCLKYEHENYLELNKTMPNIGEIVKTPQGEGTVMSLDLLRQRVKIKIKLEDGSDELILYEVEEIDKTGQIDTRIKFVQYKEEVDEKDLKGLEE